MKIFVKLIIKVLVNNEIKLFAQESILPEMELGNCPDIEDQIINFVKEEYNFLQSTCCPKLLNIKLTEQTLFLYYNFYYPKDFIDEKHVDKIVGINNKFINEDAIEIRRSIQIPPY